MTGRLKLIVWCLVGIIALTVGPALAQKGGGDSPAAVVPPRVPGKYLSLSAMVYQPGQPVTVTWRNTPGGAKDWITFVKAGSSDRRWGKWTYLKGHTSGRFTVRNLPPGAYEVRLYFNWPQGGFKVIERLSFRVAGGGAGAGPQRQYLSLPATVFPAGRPVTVTWRNTPGGAQDWITFVKAGSSDRSWGKWTYLKGHTSGRFTVRNLPPGAYEVRLYFNWPRGRYKVIERLPFSVR
jgi:hypothetical protein